MLVTAADPKTIATRRAVSELAKSRRMGLSTQDLMKLEDIAYPILRDAVATEQYRTGAVVSDTRRRELASAAAVAAFKRVTFTRR